MSTLLLFIIKDSTSLSCRLLTILLLIPLLNCCTVIMDSWLMITLIVELLSLVNKIKLDVSILHAKTQSRTAFKILVLKPCSNVGMVNVSTTVLHAL